MRRLLTASALFALALATAATGQPPKEPPKEAPAPMPPKKAEPKAPNPLDAAIAAALANDPDVKMAQAKIQLAEAELAKARQAATLKVLGLNARLEQLRTEVRGAELQLGHLDGLVARGLAGKQPELLVAREKLEAAKAALAAAEAELKLLTGGAAPLARTADEVALAWLAARAATESNSGGAIEAYRRALELRPTVPPPVKGPIPDQLRAALDKPVRLAPKGEVVKLDQALEVFKKEAGLDIPVRGELLQFRPRLDARGEPLMGPNGQLIQDGPQIASGGETLPVGAWFQLFQDECGGTFYVREYGLLFATKQTAPPDAPTLTEFWKQKAAPKPDAAPEPKAK